MAGEEANLKKAIGRYPRAVASTALVSLKKIRSMFPGARLEVYDRPRSLPIGFAPAEGGGAVFSVVLYPRWVRFFFLQGAALDDPERRLEGTGKQVRSILLDDEAEILDDPDIRELMEQALNLAGSDLKTGRSRIIIKSRFTKPRD